MSTGGYRDGTVILVGGGVAAGAAARGLRDGGFIGRLVLVSDESEPPYERPPLTKEYLAGDAEPSAFTVNPADWYSAADVDLLLETRVESLDPAAHRATLSDGRTLDYTSLVLATGSRPRRVDGLTGEHIHMLRTLADARRLDAAVQPGRRIAILGGGFVGCELAALAAERGAQVTLLSRSELPLAGPLGDEIAEELLAVHREHGVDVRCGDTITELRQTGTGAPGTMNGTPDSGAAGLEVHTAGGDTLICHDLVVGVGSVPNTELAAAAGLTVDGGIVTDEFGRTSAPDVYAIGDVAKRFHPVYGEYVRVEHHDTAMRHGLHVAAQILGDGEPFTEEHYFWSDQYDHKLQAIGHYTGDDAQRVVRGSIAERSFAVLTLAGGRIRAIVAMNRPGDLLQVRKLLAKPHTVTAEQIADESFPLKRLLPRARSRKKPMEVG